jgi:hypothetical protein
MRKHVFCLLLVVAVGISFAGLAAGQETKTTTTTTVTKTIENPDGTYTVIEYPVGKEVTVTLNPITINNANGVATILRNDNGTQIKLNLTGIPANVTALNLYAVDDTGAVTPLGPVAITNGAGTYTSTTPLNKFMLIASAEPSLAAYDPNTKILFRSAVPEGFAIVPIAKAGGDEVKAVGERVGATTSAAAESVTYAVPMLDIPNLKRGSDTEMHVNFTGPLAGARANVFILPRKDGPSEVRVRFHELKEAPAGKVYVLWAATPENKFVKLGQMINAPGRNEAEIKSETSLPDFGLLITMENAGEVTSPHGPRLGSVEMISQ